MPHGLPPPPRAITPDTALPSIEREMRPGPAPFSFTGEQHRHVPFDFRPPDLSPPFRPEYSTRPSNHHPIGSAYRRVELLEEPPRDYVMQMPPPPPPSQYPLPPPPPYHPPQYSQAEHFPSGPPWQPFTYGQPPPPCPGPWRPGGPPPQSHYSPQGPR
jgi:hypothetical protein